MGRDGAWWHQVFFRKILEAALKRIKKKKVLKASDGRAPRDLLKGASLGSHDTPGRGKTGREGGERAVVRGQ